MRPLAGILLAPFAPTPFPHTAPIAESAFNEVRSTAACTGANRVAARAVQLLGDLDVSEDGWSAVKKIILSMSNPKIDPPIADVPDPRSHTTDLPCFRQCSLRTKHRP